MSNPFLQVAAYRTLDLLRQRRAILFDEGTVFWVWERPDRAVIVFDPNAIELGKVNHQFTHELSTRLNGRRVVRTNSRGLFLQVGYEIPPAKVELSSEALDLSRQGKPFDMPIGMTSKGEQWVSLLDGDSFLVAGSRGMGKTGFLHGWIQALLHGGQTLVYAHDGKQGVEFARYLGSANFTLVENLENTLRSLRDETMRRRHVLLKSGHANIVSYNADHAETPIMPIALFVDEAALTSDDEKASLVQIVERERDTGVYPILATNRPEAAALLVKTNLVTRVCFPVPSWNASQMVLGMNGAESLPKVQGRGLIVYQARVVEFQSFVVKYPLPSIEVTDALIVPTVDGGQLTVDGGQSDVERLAEGIRGQWSPTMSRNAVAKLLGWKQYGGANMDMVRDVIAYLASSTSTMAQNGAEMPVLEAVGA